MEKLKQYLFMLAGLCLMLFAAENVHALTPIEAGQKGIDWMVPNTVNWQNAQRCFGCHIQGETIWGLSIGKSRGYTIDTANLSVFVNALKGWQCSTNGSWYWSPGCSSAWQNEATVFAASALAFYDRMAATDAQASLLKAAGYLKSVQQPSGYWYMNSNGTPIMNGPYYWGTAMGIVAMKRASDLTGDAGYKSSYEKAVNWLKTQYSTSVQDNAFKLIGLIEGGVPATDSVLIDTQNRLLSAQNADGGWGRYAKYSSNGYNTGQAVYSLRLAGMLLQDSRIDAGIKWLVANQNPAGYWPTGSSGVGTLIASTMWPVIALGQFGSLGVEISADPLKQQVLANDPNPQTVSYAITVKNTGSQIQDDTYDITVTGAMEGWSASLDKSAITLVPGASGTLTLTVTAPPALPDGLPSILTITAVSRTSKDVTSSVMVTTYTPPEPPLAGHKTTVAIVAGNNSVISQCDKTTLSAKVVDQTNGATLIGPGKGAVNFLVAGIAVGSASDNDGTGLFTVAWTPGTDWTKLNAQSLLAVYSGVDLPDTSEDLLSSFAIGSITINPATCNQAPVANAGPDQRKECEGPNDTAVTLDGSGSSDPDGDALTYSWTWQGGSASGVRPTVALPYGTTTATLIVNDGKVDSAPSTVTVTVQDTMPPETTATVAGVSGQNGWYVSDVAVTLNATDRCTGVKEIHYTVNGSETVVAGATASFTLSQDGTYLITYWAMDNAGREGAHGMTPVKREVSPPVTTPGVPAPPSDGNGYYRDCVPVTLTATAGVSGIAAIEYSLDNGLTWLPYHGSFTVCQSATITYRAVSTAGNVEQPKSLTIKIDMTPPVITASVSPAPNANGWHNTDVTVTFTCSDIGSGIASCPSQILVTTEGAGQAIAGTAVDVAGNKATASVTLNIDKTAPAGNVSLSPGLLWPPNHKMVNVAVNGGPSDGTSGIASVVFTVTDEYGTVQPAVSGFNTTIPLEAWREGADMDGRHYTVTAVITDKAGNQTTVSTGAVCPHDMRDKK